MSTDLGPESHTFLEQMPNLILGTIRSDGSPQASPVWYLWTGSSFLVSTIETTAKWKNLLRDRRCSVCVDNPETGQMIVAYGEATLHTENVLEKTRDLVGRYYPDEPGRAEAHLEQIFNAPHRRVMIDVLPHTIITRGLDG